METPPNSQNPSDVSEALKAAGLQVTAQRLAVYRAVEVCDQSLELSHGKLFTMRSMRCQNTPLYVAYNLQVQQHVTNIVSTITTISLAASAATWLILIARLERLPV